MRDVTLAQTRGPVKPARRARRDAGERAAWPARHGSGSLREPPLGSPRAAHRAVERAAGPRREVSHGHTAGFEPALSARRLAGVSGLAFLAWLGGVHRLDREHCRAAPVEV